MQSKHISKKTCGEQGTLLVELLVAFVLVSVTLVTLLSAFLSLQRGYRIEEARRDVANSLASAVDDMVREARVSDRYGDSCGSSPCNFLDMWHIDGLNGQVEEEVRYDLNGTQLEKTVAGGVALPLTPPNTKITSFQTRVYDASDERLRVLVSIVAEPTNALVGVTPVYLQTTITERGY